jgi:hypothetical protein
MVAFSVMWKFWICLLVGLFAVLAWLGMREEGAASQHWPSAPGLITERRVTDSVDKDGGHNRNVRVRYTYTIGGKEYQGDRVGVGGSGDIDAVSRNYSEGKRVAVFYNPSRPDEAVLEPGSRGTLVWGLVGFGFLAYAFYSLVERRRKKLRSAPVVSGSA